MVITVTLNPAMDKTVSINNFGLGKVNRVNEIRYDIGGKGINVSKVLKNFEIQSKCTGFLGGIWLEKFKEELGNRGVNNDFIEIKESTRTNVKVVDHVNKVYTDINEAGPIIGEKELDAFINKYTEICKKDDIVVLSGGAGPNIPKDIYRTLINIAKDRGVVTVLDAEGDLLKYGLEAKPDIIKPNEHEFELLLSKELNTTEQIIQAAEEIIKDGIKQVLVSLGEKGALYVTKNGSYYGKGLKVPVKSTVGAGDSTVAALVYSKIKTFDEIETLRFAIACGGAAVSVEGTEACKIGEVQELIKRVEIEKLS